MATDDGSFSWPPSGGNGIAYYTTFSAFPVSAAANSLAIAEDTGILYEFYMGAWIPIAGPGFILSVGTIDSEATPSANGATIQADQLIMQSASVTVPGLVNNSSQSFSGNKTFTGTISASNLSGTNSGDVTIGTANGLSLAAQVLSLGLSSTSTTGALSSVDWNTFNNKQASGPYITALTGDGTASGPGSAAFTLATVNSNVGSFTNASLTVNAKGLVTAASSGTAPVTSVTASLPIVSSGGSTPNLTLPLTTNDFLIGVGGTATAQTGAQATALLSPFVGDSGSGGTQGVVPAPAQYSYASGDFLSAGGSFIYVDQSKTRQPDFSLIVQQAASPSGVKFESTVIFKSITTGKNYAIGVGFVSNPLTLWDISDQTSPVLISTIVEAAGGAYNVSVGVVSGVQYAFVGYNSGSKLAVFNLTNPNAPTLTGTTVITGSPGSIYGVLYFNGYVYCATQSTGLVVMDVSVTGTPAAPAQVFQQGGSVKSFGVATDGTNIYTTSYSTSNPYTTRQIISWTLSGAGTPAVPSLLQSLQVTSAGEALGMSINASTHTAFVTTAAAGAYNINIVDITTPSSMSNLSQINSSNTFGSAFYAVGSGNYVYVPSGGNATYGGAIDVYDITTRTNPIHIAQATSGVASSAFGGIALSGGYIFVADYGAGGGTSPMFDVFSDMQEKIVAGNIAASTATYYGLVSVEALNISTAGSGVLVSSSLGVISSSASISASQMLPLASGDVYIGNGSNQPVASSMTVLTSDLNLFTSSLQGLVSASGGGATNFLRADDTWVGVLQLSGGTMTGQINGGGFEAINFADPTVGTSLATKEYVDAIASGLEPIQAVYAGTIGSNIAGSYLNGVAGVGATFTTTSTATFTLDGTTPPLLSRILIKDQTSGLQNGVYTFTALPVGGISGSVFTRSLDYDTATEMNSGAIIPIINGTVNAPLGIPTFWIQTATITNVGTDSLVFVKFNSGGSGTVTSVAMTVPSILSVSGSPITTSGTLAISLATQNANLVFAGPSSGGAATPTFRSFVNADLPTSGASAGTYTNATVTVNAQGIVTSASNGSGGGGGVGNLNARFNLNDAIVPYVNIDGPHYQYGTQTLSSVSISMLNSGTSGSTVIQVNQYRSGSLQASATASISASSGNPAGSSASLSSSLSLLAGDIITVDVNSVAGGLPESLTVEY